MNDLYEYKANKYKLKYLKLKKQLYGGNDSIYCKAMNNKVKYLEKLDMKQIFCDSYDNKIDDKIEKPQEMILNNFVNIKHTGKLFTKENFNKFNDNYKIIKDHDKIYNNIEKIRYIGEITYDKNKISSLPTLPNFFSKKISNKTKKKYFIKIFSNCKIWEGKSKEYIYIISTDVGTPFSKLFRGSINNNNIQKILTSLKEGINNLITNLYNANYILNNINEHNITFNLNNNNIYFINFEKLSFHDNTNKNNDIKALIEFIKLLFSADLSKNEYSGHPLNYKFNFGYGTEHSFDTDSFINVYDLVKKLDYKNINDPTSLCEKLDKIIEAIPVPS
jgi:hypothetical protein